MSQLENGDLEEEAMVKSSVQQLATMEQAARQTELASKLLVAFSLYIGERYAKSCLLFDWLFPDLKALPPELKAQLDQRWDKLEEKLNHIRQQTVQQILKLID